jgi:uncharacterized protein (DUF433 family)
MDGSGDARVIDLAAFRTRKAYTFADAARLVKTNPQNVRRWMHGYQSPGHRMEPVFGGKERNSCEPAVSFLELVELAIASEFRRGTPGQSPVPLARVRSAHKYLRDRFGLDFPFASVRLRSEGGQILHDFTEREPGEGTLVVSMGGQWMLPDAVLGHLDDLEYRDDLAVEWFPFGHSIPIRVNPLIAAGRPTVAGTGVRVETLRERINLGESKDDLSKDYGIPLSKIEQVLDAA